MQRNINPAVRVLTLLIVIFGLTGLAVAPATAQSVPCVDEPLLGTFDGNGDGVLTVGEVRSAAPDNDEIQNVADQMESAGVSGIRYAGCEGTGDGGNDGGSDNAGDDGQDGDTGDGGDEGSSDNTGNEGGDEGSSDNTGDEASETDADDQGASADDPSGGGDATATPDATSEDDADIDQPNDSDWFDERLTVTTLPAVGSGSPDEAGQPATLVVTSMVGIALLLASASTRVCQLASAWRSGH